MMGSFPVIFFVIFLARIMGELTVLKATQYIYEKSPKLRIRGSGFDALDLEIILEIGSPGQPYLTADKDFLISKDSTGLVLKLLGNRRYDLLIENLFCFCSIVCLLDGATCLGKLFLLP